ncbi:MAG TPA: hypothetical protein VLH08_15245, partial [Acidobacteriota bacterium]|nr:hypothetical protein [Acidobacteriota bacterium]
MRTLFRVFVLVLLSIQFCCSDTSDKKARRWHFHLEELRIQSLQQALSEKYKPQDLAFVNANLISMKDDQVQPSKTVLVSNGKIIVIKSADEVIPENFLKIDCTNRYLMPGIADMHVHNLVSSSQHLLNLANGITTVRDMDGFPWMLKMRDQIGNNRLLAPTMYVAGHILNQRAMDMYATVVNTPEEARKVVRNQKAAGYDFIKVHNTMSFAIYSAILDEAKKLNIDVVGHIPHDITIRQAVEQGQKTFEHFKAYILDSTLTLTKENYVQATKNISNWNCPTFYNYRGNLRGDEARKLIRESVEMKYVSWIDKKDWMELANEKPDAVQQNVLPLSIKIFKDLLPIYDKFLAGTDSGGGYPFMVPGFSLQEELRIMNNNGLNSYQTLKTATVNAAAAMN